MHAATKPLRLLAYLALAPLLLAGCAGTEPAREVKEFYWPMPPEQPRFMYEAELRGTESIRKKDDTTRMQRLLVGADPAADRLNKPLGVAARGGRIYVTDTEARRIVVFDLPRRKYYYFGHREEGGVRKPAGIAVDEAQNVYVADVTLKRVLVYDGLGLFLRAIGSDADFSRPTGVAVSRSGDRVYVVDAGGVESAEHRVVAYDAQGKKLFALGPRGAEPGQFNLPVDANVAPDGTLYVLDSGNFRVQAFDRDGKFLRSFGSVGSGLGQFARPRGIATDPDGNVYVSDAVFGNVQVFTPQGELLIALGNRSEKDGPGQFRLLSGIAVDETKRLYVVDQFFRKIEVIRRLTDSEGQQALKAAN